MQFDHRNQTSGEGGENKFLQIKDGESVTGIFRGEPYRHFIKWIEGKSIDADENEREARPRFKLNFITNVDGALKALIWNFSQTVYNQLAEIHDEYPLESTKLKITRRGTGKETMYSILPLLKEPLSSKQLDDIAKVQLQVLGGEVLKPKPSVNGPDFPMSSGFDELPF